MKRRTKKTSPQAAEPEESLTIVVEDFVGAITKYGAGIEASDHKMSNKQYRRYDRLRKRLKQKGEVGWHAIHMLLEHSNPWVRMVAASTYLKYHEAEAMKVLEALVRGPGIVGFNAKIVLHEWRAGRLRS
jgi:hypothetical protein